MIEYVKDRLPRRVRRSLALTRIASTSLKHRHKGYRDFMLSSYSAVNRLDRSYGRPVHLSLEPTNICNLRCPVCETGNGTLGRVKRHLGIDQFKHVIDSMQAHVNVLYFYFVGEPFLAMDSYEMIEHATRKQIWVDTCTNGEFVDAKNLLDSGLGRICFQLGGMTQETHETYRVGGVLEKAVANLAACVEEKRRRPDCKTQIKTGFIVMKHNEHEVDEFVRFAKDIGVDAYEVVDPAVRTLEEGDQFLTSQDKYWYYDREAFNQGILRPKSPSNHYCEWIYYTTTIQVNGDVVPCCRDPRGVHVLGNVFEQDFVSEIWNGELYRDFRHMVAHNQKDTGICDLCSGYTAPDINRHDPVQILPAIQPVAPRLEPEPAGVLV